MHQVRIQHTKDSLTATGHLKLLSALVSGVANGGCHFMEKDFWCPALFCVIVCIAHEGAGIANSKSSAEMIHQPEDSTRQETTDSRLKGFRSTSISYIDVKWLHFLGVHVVLNDSVAVKKRQRPVGPHAIIVDWDDRFIQNAEFMATQMDTKRGILGEYTNRQE